MAVNTIAVIAFNNISPFHLSVPCLFFGEDRRSIDIPQCKFMVCASEDGNISTTIGFSITTQYSLKDLDKADLIIVPSWRDTNEPPPLALIQALQKAHSRGATLVGLCLGTFVLAATGLLDGRHATTHWGWAEELRQKFPLIHVDPDVLYIDEGDVITSAGAAAGIDCCLHIIRKHYGAETAIRLARRLVVPPHRQGGQAQFIERPVRNSGLDDRFSLVLEWAQANLEHPISIDILASRACMSRRTFTRHFRKYTGTTMASWVIEQRLTLAQHLLETTNDSIELIAQRAGFGSSLSLRQNFTKTLNVSPNRYRREFRLHLA